MEQTSRNRLRLNDLFSRSHTYRGHFPFVTLCFFAALLLRAGLMAARSDFLEFDEAFYLLIARNLSNGDGYVMNGLPQIAFPPLPTLIYAAVGWLVGDLVRASRVVSVILGAGLVFPIAALARRAFGEKTAGLSAVLVAILPSLLTFVPLSRPYAESLYFGPEPIYVFLFATSGLLLARTVSGGRAIDAMACGAFSALTYLTRNEAIVFAPAAVAVILIGSSRRLRCALLFTVTSATLALPYPAYLHQATGSWSISGKDSSAALIRESIVAKVRDDDPAEFERLHYALAPGNTAMLSTYWGYDASSPEHTGEGGGLLGVSGKGIVENISVYVGRLLPILVPWYLWPFVLAGAGFCLLGRRETGGVLSMAAMATPSLAVCLVLFVEPRHHLYLAPILSILAARGLVGLSDLAPGRLRIAGPIVVGVIAATMLAVDLGQLARLRSDDSEVRTLSTMRELGEELDASLPPEEPIMSWHPAIAYHARRPWRVMPASTPRRLAAYAAARDVRVIVYETAVHGVPPGGVPGVPFTLVELAGLSPAAIMSRGVSFRFLENARLYQRYELQLEDGQGEP